ncbi:MAG: PEP/pyruvate-binding domain-containing protein [Planctomycetota bacterium]|jgi:pyruvate,water dikinase
MEMKTYSRWLDEVDKADMSLVGGKSSNLGEMLKLEINVPFGFCITTVAYQEFLQQSNLMDCLAKMLGTIDYDDHDGVKDVAEKMKAATVNQEIPIHIKDDITVAYNRLRDDTKTIHFAIRSSCTYEDLPDSSFAGQYDTYLGVSSITDLLLSVKNCWASLWNGRALVYRERKNIDHLKALMAVIVQPMIACKQSGVMFTVNPVSNDRDEILINSSWGLGEGIVSGQVAGDEHIVNKASEDIKAKKISNKDIEIVQRAEGIKRIQVASDKRMQQCLSDEQIKKLVSIGLKLEEHFGHPQDIEWGIVDDDIYVFQTREITTLDRNKDVVKNVIKELRDKTSDQKTVWCNTLLSEIMPSAKPMSWEILKLGLSKEGSFGIYISLGLGKVASEGLLELISGKPYYNVCKLCDAFSFYGLPIKLFDYKKIKKDPSQANNFQPQLDYGKCGEKLLLFVLKFVLLLPYSLYKTAALVYKLNKLIKNCHTKYTEEILPSYLKYIEETNNRELEQLSEKELVDEIEQLIRNWACITVKDHIYSEICFGPVCTLLEFLVGENQASILLSGFEGNKLLETNFQLWTLAGQASPEVADIIINNKPSQIVSNLLNSESGRDYLDRVRRFLQEYGHRTSDEYELATTRWHEEPAKVFQMIQHYLKSEKANPVDHFEKQKRTRTELEQKLIEEYSIGIYKLLPVERKLFLFALKYSQLYSAMRETTKFYHFMEYAQLRRFLVELGIRLSDSENSCIEENDDIFYLLPKELPLIVQNELSCVQVRQLVSKRKHDYKMNLSIQLPPVIFYDSLDKLGEPVDITASDVLKGTPVSGGSVEGKVRIIHNPSEFGKFQEGEILVAPRTDVGWTPLFFTAKALVMDVGNVLSHGAVIAREYGLPAVVNVKDASRILKDGQEIVVDAEEGKVYISKTSEKKL